MKKNIIITVALCVLILAVLATNAYKNGKKVAENGPKIVEKEPKVAENEPKVAENEPKIIENEPKVIESSEPEAKNNNDEFIAFLTHYGPDCSGCSGITASGYNVTGTIYYDDAEYGEVRIVAAGRNIPFYSIIEMPNYKGGSIIAIVLDRGGSITNERIDLLVASEAESNQLGIQKDVKIKILRRGK